ncbi:MAG: hypothetical protein GWO24_30625, partial [Akkermansiaceae bacterium]|nr:hypothetical protein [Akkermansiaceae bacterium]
MRSTLKLMAPLAALAGLCATGYSDHHGKPVDITGVWKVVATSESG